MIILMKLFKFSIAADLILGLLNTKQILQKYLKPNIYSRPCHL